MHPLKELKKILEKKTPNNGKVITSGTSLLVATNQGQFSITPTPGDATKYTVGDDVILSNGVIIGRRNRSSTIYVL
jgi:hypothetical protein